jgi:predicted kinase
VCNPDDDDDLVADGDDVCPTTVIPERVLTSMIPTAHLLNGFIGSGKTTFARKLEQNLPAVRFTHDEWMAKLYGQNPPVELFGTCFERVEDLIWQMAASVLRAGGDVILDFGFWSRESRDTARDRVASAGAVAKFYSISCPEHIMRARTLARSENPPVDSLWIDMAAYEKFKTEIEPMESDEDFVRIDGTA